MLQRDGGATPRLLARLGRKCSKEMVAQPPLSSEAHNLLVLFVGVGIACWVLRLFFEFRRVGLLRNALVQRRLVRLRGLGDRLSVFERVSRTHFLALVHTRQASPPSRVSCVAVPLYVVPSSLRVHSEAGMHRISEQLRLCFAFNSRQPLRIQLFWGLHPSFLLLNSVRGAPPGGSETNSASLVMHARDRVPLMSMSASSSAVPTIGGPSSCELVFAAFQRDLEALAVHSGSPQAVPAGCGELFASDDDASLPLPASFPLTWQSGDADARFPLAILVCPDSSGERDMEVGSARRSGAVENEITSQLLLLSLSKAQPDDGDGESETTATTFAPQLLHQVNLTAHAAFVAQEIFGMDEESGAECVICLTNPKDTTLLPCRHLCVCCECLKHIDKCPVCRSPFDTYMVFDGELPAPTPQTV